MVTRITAKCCLDLWLSKTLQGT